MLLAPIQAFPYSACSTYLFVCFPATRILLSALTGQHKTASRTLLLLEQLAAFGMKMDGGPALHLYRIHVGGWLVSNEIR